MVSERVMVFCRPVRRIPPGKSRTIDSAFWVEPCLSLRVRCVLDARDLEPGQFLAVTTRQWYGDRQHSYHGELAAVIDDLVPCCFRKAGLVVNMIDPRGQMGDDRQVTRKLYQLIKKKEYVSVLDDDLAPSELVGFYGQAQPALGTCLHSVIMALAAGTPVVAVAYIGHKTQGVMQAVGLHQYATELDMFTRESATSLVLSALSTHNQIADRVEKLRQGGNAIFQASVQTLAGSTDFLNA